MSDSTSPQPPPDTAPDLPEDPIPAGKASLHVAGAFVDLLAAVARAQAVCAAIARQLDSTARK